MREIAPDYYPLFRCIADKCRHSCCVGWEIDIDSESLKKYRILPGALGEELRSVMETEGDCAHFRLSEGERCPFLDHRGLCRLICECGEGILCQICADHPRFRSEFSHCTETGLGLCCEAAARLILTRGTPMALITLSDDNGGEAPDEYEEYLLALRAQLFSLLEDDSWTVDERLQNILDLCGAALPEKSGAEWGEVFRSLERLDSAWDSVLDTLPLEERPLESAWDRPMLNLAAYFLFRHLSGAVEDGEIGGRAAFAVLSTRIIRRLFSAAPVRDMDTLIELCRLYSSEIEYSTDNTDALIALCAGAL